MAMGDETLPNGGKAPGEGVWGILKAFMCIGYRLCAFLLCGSLRVLMQHFMQISSKPFFLYVHGARFDVQKALNVYTGPP
jgi:hypothetical protein